MLSEATALPNVWLCGVVLQNAGIVVLTNGYVHDFNPFCEYCFEIHPSSVCFFLV